MRAAMTIGILLSVVAYAAGAEIGAITQMKEMYLQTALVAGGKAMCVIAVPDDAAYMPPAQKLAGAIKAAYGAAPSVQQAGKLDEKAVSGTNIIALGVFANNKIVEDLYLREFVLCDYNWPGGETSYVIRTVHNPWLTGKNVVYLGSTSLAGCEAAVTRFVEMLADCPGGSVGPIIEVIRDGEKPPGLSDEQVAAQEAGLADQKSQTSIYQTAQAYANSYFITGQPGYARLLLSAMRKLDQLHDGQSTIASTAGCQWIFQYFDAIEEGPAFTNEERLELTNLFYRFACRLPEAGKLMEPIATSLGNKVMTFVQAGLYFSRYYPDLEVGKTLLANADTMHAPDMVNWKPPEDDLRYRQLTTVRSIKYCLTRPDRRYIDTGLLRKSADYEMIITNNRGNGAGFGDACGLSDTGRHLVEVWPLAAWMYKDGRYLWWWDHFAENPTAVPGSFYRPRGQGLMGWVPPEVLPRERPDDMLGITIAPLDQWIYDRRNVEAQRKFPIEECYDKVAFRAGLEREDQYMCMSGFSWGYHSHPDGNAIVNYCDRGRTVLYDDGYMVAQTSEHNTVIVLKDGWTAGVPELAQIRADADFADVGIFESRLNDYNGVNWDRCVIWPKSKYFLVIDNLQAAEAGNYAFQCIWRTLGKADLDGRRWVSANPPAEFNLIACSDATLTEKPSAGTNINAPPFPLDQARRLVQSVGVKLEVQDSYQFANLIYTSQDGAEGRRVEAYRLGDTTTYLIADDGAPAVAGINRSEGIDGLKVDGAAFHLFGNKLTVAAGTGIDVGGLSLSADKPVNAQIELDSGKALVESRQEVQLAITDAKAGQQKVQLKPGRHSLSLHPAGGAELQQIAAQMREKLQGMAAAPAAVGKPAAGSGKGVGKLWEHSYPISAEQNKAAGNSKHPCAMMVADADDDGKAEAYVAGKDNALRAIGPDGKELWRYDLPAVIHELAISGKGAARQILIGCDDSNIYALKPDGSLNWSVLVPARSWARPGYAEGDLTLRQGKPVVLVGVDLDGDGNEEIVCGSHYGHVYAFDGNGRLLWDDVTHTPHSMTCGAACDLDGDGKQEVVMGSIYANAIIFSATGGKVGSAGGSGHAGATCAACADLDGDGKGEIAIGDKLGILWLQGPGEDGRWTKSQNMRTYNAGADISAVAMGDVNADGKLEIAAASKNFMLYLFDAAREPIWQLNLGDVCLDIDLADVTGDGKLEVICGCEDGQVKIVNSDGQIIGWYQASDVVWRVRACELDGKPQTKEIVASCDDGKVCGLQIGK